jgi:hypothetical protein
MSRRLKSRGLGLLERVVELTGRSMMKMLFVGNSGEREGKEGLVKDAGRCGE